MIAKNSQLLGIQTANIDTESLARRKDYLQFFKIKEEVFLIIRPYIYSIFYSLYFSPVFDRCSNIYMNAVKIQRDYFLNTEGSILLFPAFG